MWGYSRIMPCSDHARCSYYLISFEDIHCLRADVSNAEVSRADMPLGRSVRSTTFTHGLILPTQVDWFQYYGDKLQAKSC
jgi:hypothetical protein